MNDDEQLRRLLAEAVDGVQPHDRLAEIRASIHPDPQIVAMSRHPRPWLYAVAGAVASAAVIGVIAYTTSVLSGPDEPGPSFAGDGGVASSAATAGPTTATATDPSAPATSAPPTTSPIGSGPEAYAVYYVGANGAGKPVLFREQHRGPTLPTVDPSGSGNDLLTESIDDALSSIPADPEYRTPWRGLATLDHASYDGSAGTSLRIVLDDTAATRRPTGMSAAEARAAVQQLVYTAQAAIGRRAPVAFAIGRASPGPHPTLLGVDISKPISNAPVLSTLSLVNILSPAEGAPVAGRLRVSGLNNSFEGNVVVSLERNGRRYLEQPTTGGTGLHRLYPWHVTLDLTQLPPGEYTLTAANGDASGQGKQDTDSRTIEVK